MFAEIKQLNIREAAKLKCSSILSKGQAGNTKHPATTKYINAQRRQRLGAVHKSSYRLLIFRAWTAVRQLMCPAVARRYRWVYLHCYH